MLAVRTHPRPPRSPQKRTYRQRCPPAPLPETPGSHSPGWANRKVIPVGGGSRQGRSAAQRLFLLPVQTPPANCPHLSRVLPQDPTSARSQGVFGRPPKSIWARKCNGSPVFAWRGHGIPSGSLGQAAEFAPCLTLASAPEPKRWFARLIENRLNPRITAHRQ